MREYTIERTNAADLVFTGERIGYGEFGGPAKTDWAHWTTVSVYRTEGGRYVSAVERGAVDRTPRFDAFTADTALDACKALIDNDNGRIGRATRLAIEGVAAHAKEVLNLLRESVDAPRASR
jgi:hypothetical protein